MRRRRTSGARKFAYVFLRRLLGGLPFVGFVGGMSDGTPCHSTEPICELSGTGAKGDPPKK